MFSGVCIHVISPPALVVSALFSYAGGTEGTCSQNTGEQDSSVHCLHTRTELILDKLEKAYGSIFAELMSTCSSH